jgi:hypothetical protein|nr:MAG TPA: major capsid protein [Caudoviricetes sp.]DAW11273.1 MAG TPA: major capsid protein [Caudoviricetes sp.]
MAELWHDAVTPRELTLAVRDFAGEYLEAERKNGHLTSYLPEIQVPSDSVSLSALAPSRQGMALNRALDAETTRGSSVAARKMSFDLPNLSHAVPISEAQLLAAGLGTSPFAENYIADAAVATFKAIDATLEWQRGRALTTGKTPLIYPGGQILEDDWGRDARMSVTATQLWSDPNAPVLDHLRDFVEAYRLVNFTEPGTLVISKKIRDLLLRNNQIFKMIYGTNATALAGIIIGMDAVNQVLNVVGLPTVVVYDRIVRNPEGVDVRVLDEDRIYMLPSEGSTDMGATFWGPTATSLALGWNPAEGAGIFTGMRRNNTIPVVTEVVSDALAMPALHNPNLAFTAKVL